MKKSLKNKKKSLLVFVLFSFFYTFEVAAQTSADDTNVDSTNSNSSATSNPLSTTNTSLKSSILNSSGSMNISEKYEQTWNAMRLKQGISYNSLNNLVEYDRWITPAYGYFVLGTINKAVNTESVSFSRNTDVIANSQTEVTSFAGIKNPLAMSLGAGFKRRLWQNDWLQINYGGLVIWNYSGSVSNPYPTGTITKTIANTNSPSDYTTTENKIGSVSTKSSNFLTLGPKIGAEIYLKWFPNVSLIADMQLLMALSAAGSTTTEYSSRTYATVAGVDQTPSAQTSYSQTTTTDTGGAFSTNQLGSDKFSFFYGTWGIRYSW